MAERPQPPADPNADLGFGSVVARESRRRLLNRDGTFNVRREGLRFWESHSLYHFLLTVSWPGFLALVVASYLAVNSLFALGYLACGPGGLAGTAHPGVPRFDEAFFFSVHTLATIGYGNVSPSSLAANLLVTAESLVGLLGFAVATGIGFARFSRPSARILFSANAVVGPYREGTALMFRIANQRDSQLVEVGAKVMLSRIQGPHGQRQFLPLTLERERVAFFPLTWTVLHQIDAQSPLAGVDENALRASDAEILILLQGTDETFAQTLHVRSSYKAEEVIFGARFRSLYLPMEADGIVRVDIRRLDEVESVAGSASS